MCFRLLMDPDRDPGISYSSWLQLFELLKETNAQRRNPKMAPLAKSTHTLENEYITACSCFNMLCWSVLLHSNT